MEADGKWQLVHLSSFKTVREKKAGKCFTYLFEKKNNFQIQKRDDLISRDNHSILLNQFIKNTEKVIKYIFNDFEKENKFFLRWSYC